MKLCARFLHKCACNRKQVKYQNATQKHQRIDLLSPIHDLKSDGYISVEVYQWEMCVQFYSSLASLIIPTLDIGNKAKGLLLKLQEVHGYHKLSMFNKKEKQRNIVTFERRQLR
jgi:hypothetical protein